jgi:hypothetical protein
MRIVKMLALGLGMLAFGGAALRADTLILQDINHTNLIHFSTGDVYGGSLAGATLNGVALPWVYCVQLTVDVLVPRTYSDTIVDNSGKIYNSQLGVHPTLGQADRIAYLLTKYANGADTEHQIALQAAIWNAENFGYLTNLATTNELSYYNTMTNDTGTGDHSQYRWMTPGINGNNQYQGLVTAVPDGGVTLMLLGGALVGLATLRRRFRA